MKNILVLSFILASLPIEFICAQTIVASYHESYQDTVYVYNGDFLYDHSGSGLTQIFAECIGKNKCRIYFRFNGSYAYLTAINKGHATANGYQYPFDIVNWNYEEVPYSGAVYTFDIPVTKEALEDFGNADLLRFTIGNYLFTATEDILYGLGRLSSRIKTGNQEIKINTTKNNRGINIEFGSVIVYQEETGNYLIVLALVNSNNSVTVFSPTHSFLNSNPDFNPTVSNDKLILSYLNCNVLPKDGFFDNQGNVNVENKWTLPIKVFTYQNETFTDISDYLNLNLSSNTADGQSYIVAFKVPKKHTRCDINFLGTSSDMDSLLIIHENKK